MIAGLLLVGCWSNAPLDQADRDGRPVIVLLDRGDEANRQMAHWLRAAEGPAQLRLKSAALVFATPAEVEAWTHDSVAEDDKLLGVDDHRILAHAAFPLVLDLGSAPPIPDQPGPDAPRPYRSAPGDWTEELNKYDFWVVDTWDRGLREILVYVPSPYLQVFGAARCVDGCSDHCDRDESEVTVSCGMGFVTPRIDDFLKRWPPEAP